jgi:hypothetical protein
MLVAVLSPLTQLLPRAKATHEEVEEIVSLSRDELETLRREGGAQITRKFHATWEPNKDTLTGAAMVERWRKGADESTWEHFDDMFVAAAMATA